MGKCRCGEQACRLTERPATRTPRFVYIGAGIAAIIAIAYFWQAARQVLDAPDVYYSFETKECIGLVDHKADAENRASKWSCDNLPAVYERVWTR